MGPVPNSLIKNFTQLVEEDCPGLPPDACAEDFLATVMGKDCWLISWNAKSNATTEDLKLFHLLQDGEILGWGAPKAHFCESGHGSSFRFLPSGVVLFTLGDGSDPTSNGRKYDILMVEVSDAVGGS